MTNELYNKIAEKYPFLSYISYGECDYIGIIQNKDMQIVSIYDYGSLKTQEDKEEYLSLGEIYWWESNRCLPINVFLKKDWEKFRYSLKTFSTKEIAVIEGPYVSLQEIAQKRVKRRSIQLVKKVE